MSDALLCDAERLVPEEVDGLRSLGWGQPSDAWPNWRAGRTAPTPADIGSVASTGLRTLRKVFGLDDDAKVTVKLHRDPILDDDGAPHRIANGSDEDEEGSIGSAA